MRYDAPSYRLSINYYVSYYMATCTVEAARLIFLSKIKWFFSPRVYRRFTNVKHECYNIKSKKWPSPQWCGHVEQNFTVNIVKYIHGILYEKRSRTHTRTWYYYIYIIWYIPSISELPAIAAFFYQLYYVCVSIAKFAAT